MEEFYNSLFGNHGYKHIGIVDVEKKIWGYEKDGVYHFCKEDLTEIDRKDIGIEEEVLAITEVKESSNTLHKILLDRQSCSNYFIIDGYNKMLADYDGSQNCQLWRINSNSIIVGEKYKGSRRYETHQSVIINGESEYDYVFTKEINRLFFFSKVYDDSDNVIEGPEEKVYFHIYSNLECIEEETECAYVWKHKNGNVHFFYTKRADNNKENLEIICSSPSDIYTRTIDYSDLRGNSIDFFKIKLYDDDYLIIPFERNHGIIVLSTGEQYYNISTNIIDFKYYGLAPHAFSDKIISREYGEPIMGGYKVNGLEFYDVYGNCLELLENPLKSHGRYFVFSIPNNNLFHKIEKLYGVIEIESHKCERVVIPPVFEKIENLGYGLFKVFYGNHMGVQHHQIEFMFSVENGIIEGKTHNCILRIDGATVAQVSDRIVAYTESRQVGLIYNGKKVIEAGLDDIRGFNFDSVSNLKGVDKYTLLNDIGSCVALIKNKKYGLFIDDRNIIKPIYDSIQCIKVTRESLNYGSYRIYAYFEVRLGDHVGIISNNTKFNKSSEIVYDKIEVVGYCRWAALIKVYRDGKVGMINSLRSGEDDLTAIPIKYSDLIVTPMNNYLYYIYSADGVYYTKDGVALLSLDDFGFVGCDEIIPCLIFRNKNNEEYCFYSFSGAKLKVKETDDNNTLFVDDKYQFNTLEGVFIHDKQDEDNAHIYSSPEDDYDYEKDAWFAMTDGQYGDMPEDFDGDYDFTGH